MDPATTKIVILMVSRVKTPMKCNQATTETGHTFQKQIKVMANAFRAFAWI